MNKQITVLDGMTVKWLKRLTHARVRARMCAYSVCHVVSLSVFIYNIYISITYNSDTCLTGFDSEWSCFPWAIGQNHCLFREGAHFG